jgi:predicted RNA-binding protein
MEEIMMEDLLITTNQEVGFALSDSAGQLLLDHEEIMMEDLLITTNQEVGFALSDSAGQLLLDQLPWGSSWAGDTGV